MPYNGWGFKLSPIVPGGKCSLCGHGGGRADPVLAISERQTVEDASGRPRTEHWTSYRCMDAFACQRRRAKAGAAW